MPRFEDLENAGLRVVIEGDGHISQILDGQGRNTKVQVGALFQSGIPFWIPPGDGGANGLTFSGTRGVFSLSAAVLTNFWNFLAAGGYAYFPAGAGGSLTAGWYFVKMTSDTAGEVFADTYTAGSIPVIPVTPTAQPDLSSGRITQTTSEITAVSTVMPGGSMGKNGILRGLGTIRANNSAGQKSLRFKIGAGALATIFGTTTNIVIDFEFLKQNAGVTNQQTGVRTGTGYLNLAQVTMASDYTSIDTSANVDVTMTLQIAVASDSILAIARRIETQYSD